MRSATASPGMAPESGEWTVPASARPRKCVGRARPGRSSAGSFKPRSGISCAPKPGQPLIGAPVQQPLYLVKTCAYAVYRAHRISNFVPHLRVRPAFGVQVTHFPDDLLIGKNQDPAGQANHFGHFGRDQDNRLPFHPCQVPDQLVNLLFRADVDSDARFVEDQDVAVGK
jgi:hypothetical protein